MRRNSPQDDNSARMTTLFVKLNIFYGAQSRNYVYLTRYIVVVISTTRSKQPSRRPCRHVLRWTRKSGEEEKDNFDSSTPKFCDIATCNLTV